MEASRLLGLSAYTLQKKYKCALICARNKAYKGWNYYDLEKLKKRIQRDEKYKKRCDSIKPHFSQEMLSPLTWADEEANKADDIAEFMLKLRTKYDKGR